MLETSIHPLLYSVMERAGGHFIPFQASLEVTCRYNLSYKHCYVGVPAVTLSSNQISSNERGR